MVVWLRKNGDDTGYKLAIIPVVSFLYVEQLVLYSL